MNSDGQVYFDLDRRAALEDLRRFDEAEAHERLKRILDEYDDAEFQERVRQMLEGEWGVLERL